MLVTAGPETPIPGTEAAFTEFVAVVAQPARATTPRKAILALMTLFKILSY
jgi:hypothetical protein